MRWLYVPNENRENEQIGVRAAFEKMLQDGVFADYQVYSYLLRRKALGSQQAALQEFLQTVAQAAPDVVFLQHPDQGYPMDRAFFQALKTTPSKPKLAIYEEDPFGHIVKPMDATFKAAIGESDICFLGGTGYLAEMARKTGAPRVRFAPHSYDRQRFGADWEPSTVRSFDAIMIGNLPCLKRIPWLHVPGGHSRKKTAELFHKQFGARFALYGGELGWTGKPYCRGKIAYELQGEAIRDAWMSVNWGQYDEIAMYCSDRLPISLACGVPHITNYQNGYEHVYANIPGLFVVKRPKEAVDAALYLLSLPQRERIELGLRAARYAADHLEVNTVYRNIVSVIQEQLFLSPSSA